MSESQAKRLNLSRLKYLSKDEYYICLEPLSLKKRDLKNLNLGTWIDLGNIVPDLQICKNSQKIASIYATKSGWYIGEIERELVSKSGNKRVILESRLSVLDSEQIYEGAWLDISTLDFNSLVLCYKKEAIAVASLLKSSLGYGLKIEELYSV